MAHQKVPAELLKDRSHVVPQAVAAFAKGEFVLVMDDFERENECDLIILGETITKEQMAFMIKHSTGIVCVVADKPKLEKLGLYPAAHDNTDKNATNFYVATDYLPTTTTGVSARDRCETVRAFARADSKAEDFSKPGHMFPLCPRPGGVIERGGHTESAYDLCRLAGKDTVSPIAELMNEDGEMMRLEECLAFSKKHNIPLITVEELRQWIRTNGAGAIDMVNSEWSRQISTATGVSQGEWDSKLDACSTCTIPVRYSIRNGLRLQMYELNDGLPIEVVAAIRGEVYGKENVAVRIHSECFTGDVLRSAKCDCGLQLEKFFSVMEKEPAAVLLYIKGHEGRGIGLAAKMEAYRLQTEHGLDTVDSNLQLGYEPDLRNYSQIAQILAKMGIKSVRLFTNNPLKIRAVEECIPCNYEPLQTIPLAGNKDYLKTKEERMEHMSTMAQSIEWPAFGEYSGFRVTIVATGWKKECSNQLVEGCEALLQASKCEVEMVEVPGALDLVSGCKAALSKERRPHAIVALGTYIAGDTETSAMHYQATVAALQELNVTSTIPIISGVTFTNSQEDAVKKNNTSLGATWARNALQMISIVAQ